MNVALNTWHGKKLQEIEIIFFIMLLQKDKKLYFA